MVKGKISDLSTLSEHTSSEIHHQPLLWGRIWQKIADEKNAISNFLNRMGENYSIVLTGAGTSAYIGLAVQSVFRKKFKVLAEPIATTHIVSHPQDHLLAGSNVLIISFARSGNSPESCAVVDLADKICGKVLHLIITCNPKGKLALENARSENAYVFTLPPEANDKSLAMTSSFTGMMLASILIARIDKIQELKLEVDKLIKYGYQALDKVDFLCEIANKNFNRAIFLGSGPLYGVAKEAQLKMQELSDGLVISKHDSFLGLRHGPKAVIDEQTLVVYHLSNNKYACKYDLDLIKTMRTNSNPLGVLAIGENIQCSEYVDWVIDFQSENKLIDEDLMSVISIVPAQLLALYKSIQLGLKPDNPSRNGAISRVVQGVSIYQVEAL